ncbi:MAG: HNH endonuclease [Chitinophagaceae bacterium]|nr:MAG: HNH endonuclease [Chitinophagaceae bacterium]
MQSIPFTIGQEYRRRDINVEFGGGWQSGISPSGQNPFIFIFSGKSGHQHGYRDRWENKDIFSYTGEGQIGNMQFTKGNLAIKEHIKNGKRIFLFTIVKKGIVRYEGELFLIDFDFFVGPDTKGNERTAIRFFLQRVGSKTDYQIEKNPISIVPSLDESRVRDTPNVTERSGMVTSRVGQGAYRKSILLRWENKCAVTGFPKKEILIASHIHPWKNATDYERLDVENGILLSPVYDALFDRRLISFENNGKIILSSTLLAIDYKSIGVTGKEWIGNLSNGNKHYLELHRCLCQ